MSNHIDDNSYIKPVLPWWLAVLFAFGWQLPTTGLLLWDHYFSLHPKTLHLGVLVFLLIPILSGLIHRSWKVSIAAILLPVFPIVVVAAAIEVIFPSGKW